MPELPEVETIRRQLAPRLVGRCFVDAWAFDSPKFDEATRATGNVVTDVARRGKYLLIGLGPHGDRTGPAPAIELVVHLGMTGRLSLQSTGETTDHPHLRAWWALDDSTRLAFHDIRRFGRVAVVEAGDYERLPTLDALGPEPDDATFDGEHLRRGVNDGRRQVKTVLLSQRVVAGVGNIYADEALWRAGIHPRSRRLTRDGAGRLRDAIRAVIDEGVEHGGTTLRDYRDVSGRPGTNQHRLDCYGRAGSSCNACGTTLVRGLVDGRSTTWCPTCQHR